MQSGSKDGICLSKNVLYSFYILRNVLRRNFCEELTENSQIIVRPQLYVTNSALIESVGKWGDEFSVNGRDGEILPNLIQPFLENIDRGSCNDGSRELTTRTEKAEHILQR